MPDETTAPKAPKPKQILRERILVRFDLTDKEMRDYGAEVGRVNAEYLSLEDQLASIKSDYKSRLDSKDAQRNTLSTKLANGYEMREVEAIVEFDAAAGRKKWTHPKTKAVLREGDMTHADWQLPMFSKEELEKIRKPKPEANAEAGKVSVGNAVDAALIEAASKQTKLEMDLDDLVENGTTLPALIKKFKELASEWPKNLSSGIAKIAKSKVEQGTAAVLDFLRPFVVSK